MIDNQSIPRSSVIPTLAYPDVRAAATWLCQTFGFAERLRIFDHRVQLTIGDGAMVVTELPKGLAPPNGDASEDVKHDLLWPAHSIMVRVDDVDAHYTHAERAGATIVLPPTTYPFGERQYSAIDIGNHSWTFTQSVADVNPRDWGGELL